MNLSCRSAANSIATSNSIGHLLRHLLFKADDADIGAEPSRYACGKIRIKRLVDGGENTTLQNSNCIAPTNINGARTPGTCTGLVFDNGNQIRSSVGVGLIWASPFGPLRFDYAIPLSKGPNDRVQQFKFGGGTSF